MNNQRALRQLIKASAQNEELILLTDQCKAAMREKYLQTAEGKRLILRLSRLWEADVGNAQTSLSEILIRENCRQSFSERDLACLHSAIILSQMHCILSQKETNGRLLAIQKATVLIRRAERTDFKALYEKTSRLHKALYSLDLHHYRSMDDRSRAALRRMVLHHAKKYGVSEADAAQRYAADAPKPNTALRRRLALTCFFLSGVLLGATAFFLCGAIAGALLLIPCFAVAATFTQALFLRILPPIPIFSLKPGAIPEKASTLVVITALFSGTKADDELFARLKKYYYRNKDKNVRFGILADLPESKTATDPGDEAVLAQADAMLKCLQKECGDHFCLFIRRRCRASGEGSYMGWERKRGAILELCGAMRKRPHSFQVCTDTPDALGRYKYLITLDADTELGMGAVSELTFTMLHPDNKPIIQNGTVVAGYGILQPRMSASLASAGRSLFSILQTGSGGKELYSDAAGDFDQNTFGKGCFCGKGILDVDAFLAVLEGVYPEERILSHDLLEGIRLRCGALTHHTFTDSVPSGVISYCKRQHRWMRGDLQSIPFGFSRHKNQKGEWVKNPIDCAGRIQLLRNLLFLLRPILCFLAVVYAAFLPTALAYTVFLFATLHLTLPFLRRLFFSAGFAARRFYSAVVQGIWHSFSDMLYGFSSLAETAFLHLDALLRSLYRMTVSKKHLLQWVTSDHAERMHKAGLAYYLRTFYKSILTGTLFLLFAEHGILSLFGLLTLLYPLSAYLISRPMPQKAPMRAKQRQQLTSYAADAFGYYTAFVGEQTHHLPPDNYQYAPTAALAERTSPTNVAMYLLSVLAATDLGFIDAKEMEKRLTATLSTLIKLPKYRGHLYNWYSTASLGVIGEPYISTVDSGNLVTALTALRQGLTEYLPSEPSLSRSISMIDTLTSGMDFSFLYHSGRHLFCIGYDPVSETQSENCYDLLMSESRTTSYYCIAKGIVEKEHWRHLGRPLIKSGGYMGMASWSGTAFEYFMPALLLPTVGNSLCYECLGYAHYEQMHDRSHGLWGRSESGYYAFDNDMNYQYKAFGAHTLALDPSSIRNDVLAPYACFLTLGMSVSPTLRNLESMRSMGMYGPHGFYEAIDFTADRVGRGYGIVRSYMAHHVGMSIVAIANAVKDDLFVKRFMRDPAMDAASELLCERIPVDVPIERSLRRRSLPTGIHKRMLLPEDFTLSQNSSLPTVAGLFGEGISAIAAADGFLSLSANQTALTYPLADERFALRGMRLLIQTDRGIMDALDCRSGKFGRFEDALVYEKETDGVLCHTALTVSGDLPLMSVTLTVEGNFTNANPLLLSEVILAKEKDWLGHPCYTGLFVECRYLKEDGVLLFKRRPKHENEKPFWFFVSMEGGGFDFLSRRDEAFPLMYGEEDVYRLFDRPFDNRDGQCIFPFFALRRASHCPRGKFTTEFVLGAGEDVDTLLGQLRRLRKENRGTVGGALAISYKKRMQNRLLASGYDRSLVRYEQTVLASVLYDTRRTPDQTVGASRELFWRHGISTDLPMLALILPSGRLGNNLKKILCGFLHTQKYLSLCGYSFDLLLLYEESEKYGCPMQKQIENTVCDCVGQGMLRRKGGIFPVSDSETKAAAPYLCPICWSLDDNCVMEALSGAHLARHPQPLRHPAVTKPTRTFLPAKQPILPLSCGAFTEQGYRVYKSRCRQVQSRIYCSHQFGTIVTESSAGVTYFRNASEHLLTHRMPDPLLGFHGERLLLCVGDGLFDLCAMAHTVDFTLSHAQYLGEAAKLDYTVKIGCDDKFPVKLISLRLFNPSDDDISLSVRYEIVPDLKKSRCVRVKQEKDTLFYRSLDQLGEQEQFGIYLTCPEASIRLPANSHTELFFLLGVVNYKNDRSYYKVREIFKTADDVEAAFARYAKSYRSIFQKISLQSPSPSLDLMFNEYIPYQILTSRIYARTGFYQSGGAYGFRDQLQDCLNIMPLTAAPAKLQILRSAAHQYAAGDVQHWWHQSANGAQGMRTRCSDDLLWLPFVTAAYVEHTADSAILQYRIPYLHSAPLHDGEGERYEAAQPTAHKESLAMHCMRALDLALERMGAKGLCLMGSGDWNDGMHLVGKDGKGESVWLSMFLVLVLERFSLACLPDGKEKQHYLHQAKQLRQRIRDQCFEKDRYIRAYFDNGKALGSAQSEECQIDLLPQAFAAFLFPDDPRTKRAMESAAALLYDRDAHILKLFTPAFDQSEPNPGYIRGYLPGIRENGGQYTHAAMWGALAFFSLGMADQGYAVLGGSNPAARCCIPSLAPIYRLEPYAIAADIYAGEHAGRGGWSQYTGAAGWFYAAVLQGMLGYRCRGHHVTLRPTLPDALPEITLQYRTQNRTVSRRLQKNKDDGTVIRLLP